MSKKVSISDCTCARPGSGSHLGCVYCHPDQGVVGRAIGDLLSKITSGKPAATRVEEEKKKKKGK